MILVDTSIWVDHLRRSDAQLAQQLKEINVAIHPFIIGELACGNLQRRTEVITLLKVLPTVTVATDEEVLNFIEDAQLMAKGVGLIDCHLLASAKLDAIPLWTRDKRLQILANKLNIAYQPGH